MGFLGYLIMGGLAYGAGWGVRTHILDKNPKPEKPYGLKHPLIIRYMLLFFIFMLVVSALLGRFVLGHADLDIPFIVINSLVATFVFSFGISPDNVTYDVPD